MYKHCLRLTDTQDNQNYYEIDYIYSDGINGKSFEQGDIILNLSDMVHNELTSIPICAHMHNYCNNYASQKKYVWNSDDRLIQEFELTIEDLKIFRISEIKNKYLLEAMLTDYSYIWYNKLCDIGENLQVDDDKYSDIQTFWHECKDEYLAKKLLINNSSSRSEIESIDYDPTHVKSWDEIE